MTHPHPPPTAAAGVAAAFWAALADHDVAAAFALVAEDAEVRIPPAGILGRAADARRFVEATLGAFPDLLLTIARSFTGVDGTTVTELKLEGTQAGDYFGVVNQEKHLDVDQVWLLRTADGRITAITGYWCQNQLYRRLAVRRLDQIAIV
ncbi:MAG: nuclear transport factor 2 family protein [Pseudonocardia sp.]